MARVENPGARRLRAVGRDLHYALRAVRQRRTLTLLAVATIGLGVGAATAMFSVVDGVLLRPLPFDRPGELVLVHPTAEEWREHPTLAALWDRANFSLPELQGWIEAQRSFASIGGFAPTSARVPAGAGSETVAVVHASPDFFATLGAAALHGRLFAGPEPEPVVVLAHGFWQRHHGGDPAIVGGDIRLNDRPVRVIGVLPAEFELPGVDAELWRPLAWTPAPASAIGNHAYRAIGRLRAGVTAEQAAAEAAALLRGLTAEHPGHVTHGAVALAPVADATRAVRAPLLILLLGAFVLLAAACGNVALLLLGAGAERARELAVRGALGAGRARLALQLMLESALLGALGVIAGLLVARGALGALLAIAPEGLPRSAGVAIDARAFALAAALALTTGLLAGCLPALSLSRVRARDALRGGATAPGGGRLQRAIVVAELALATVLLVGAGLLTRTMDELGRVEPGFDAADILTVQLTLPYDRLMQPGEPADASAARLRAWVERLRTAVAATPGVEAVALTSNLPYSADGGTTEVQPEGARTDAAASLEAAFRFVSANYFDVLRAPPLEGRTLTAADEQPGASPVMLVSESFARAAWPDGGWLDRRVGFWGVEYRVVGVSHDMREHDLRGDHNAFKLYVPPRNPTDVGHNLLVRSAVPPAALAPALRAAIWDVDDGIAIRSIATMEERIGGSVADFRYRMRLMSAFGGSAALFALLGVYGVMSRTVARRRPEVGVRLALGARRADIVALVLRDVLRLGVLGVAAGLAAAAAATRVLESVIWGVPRTDALTFAAIAGALLALAVLVTLAPARRAAATQPMSILRG